MIRFRYSLQNNVTRIKLTFESQAINFAQMLGKIEREKNLDEWRVVEIREIKGSRR